MMILSYFLVFIVQQYVFIFEEPIQNFYSFSSFGYYEVLKGLS